MKRLLPILMLVSSLAFGQAWDSTQTTDTPRGGMYKFNAGIKGYILGKKADTTGISGFSHPIMVLQGDSLWVAKEGIEVGADSGYVTFMVDGDSLVSLKYSDMTNSFAAINRSLLAPVYNVRSYGADPTGMADSRSAIQLAIDAASASGGGTVYFPRGTYLLSSFVDTGYTTPDSVAAPIGYPTSFTTSDVHLRDTVGNVVFSGEGYGSSIITTASPSIVLLITKSHKDSLLNGVKVDGLTFQYTGGYLGERHGASYGIWLLGKGAIVSNCKFKNFLNSVIVARNSEECDISHNTFEAEHGRASVGYPLYPDRDTGDVYWAHPATFVRNYGLNTKMAFNHGDGLTNPDFTGISAPDSFKSPMDGFNHGSGTGGVLLGNSIVHFYYEGFYVEEGPSTSTATLVISGNTADGTVPTMTNGIPSTHSKYSVLGRYGIRTDCWNATVTGNTVRNISQDGILVSYASDPQRVFNISGNTLQNVARGIRIDSTSRGTITGNTIIGVEPTQTQKDSGLIWQRAIEIARSKSINVSGNIIYGTHTGWYNKLDTAKTASDSGTTFRIYMTTTGIEVGDWVVAHYRSSSGGGEPYYIDTVEATYVSANTLVYVDIGIGDSLFVVKGADQYVNDGIVLASSDSCHISGNTFVHISNPIFGIGSTNAGSANVYFDCISDPTGSVPSRFSLIGGATPISTSGSIYTSSDLYGRSLTLQAWQSINTDSGAIYLRPGSGQIAMLDGTTKRFFFDLYDSTTQTIHLTSDTVSFFNGGNVRFGETGGVADSAVTAKGIHSVGGIRSDQLIRIGSDTAATQAYARAAAAGVADSNTWLASDYQVSLKAPLASPSFTGTVTLPTELTGTLRASSGITSATASDTVGLAAALAAKATTISGTDTVTRHNGLSSDYTPKWDGSKLVNSGIHWAGTAAEFPGNIVPVGVYPTSHYYFLTDMVLLNKAATDWLNFMVRNTSGSEAVVDLAYIGTITGTATTRGQDAFTGTAEHDTVTVTGASVNDLYFITYTGTAAASANDTSPRVEATGTGFIVHRAASGTSGLTYNWFRMK